MKRKELIEKWADALESGEYKQTQGQLRYGKHSIRYCCLGVVCDLVDHEKMETDWNGSALLPKTVSSKLGMDDCGTFRKDIRLSPHGKYYTSLAHLNDSGVKFPVIARIIREQFEAKNFKNP